MSEPGQHLRNTIQRQGVEVARLLLDLDSVKEVATRLLGARRIFLSGTGTSYHGAMVGEHLLRAAGFDARAIPAFELSQYPPRLSDEDGLILLSHRGTKQFSTKALQPFLASSRWIAIVGEGTPLSGPGVILTVPQEKSPVHTASHVGAMLRIAQLANVLGGLPVPHLLLQGIEAGISARDEVTEIAAALAGGGSIFLAGGGPAWATALEGALKLREAALVSAEGYELEGILHGPLISIDPGDTVVLVAEPGPSLDRVQDVAAGLAEIGARLLALGSAADRVKQSTWVLKTLAVPEIFAPLVNVVPLQWMAYELSRYRQVDADLFRRDDPRYAAAQERYKL